MTEEDKKKLTEWMGECWIVPNKYWDYGIGIMRESKNRTFTSDADMLALFRKLAEKCEWEKFYQWAMPKYAEIKKIYTGVMQQRFVAWLLENPERSCSLVAEFKPWEK